MRDFLTESTVTTVLNLLMIFIYFIVMFLYNVKLTLLLIAFVVPMALLTVLVTPKIKQYAAACLRNLTDAKSLLMETLGGVETVKGMGIERPVRMRWEGSTRRRLEVQYRAQRSTSWSDSRVRCSVPRPPSRFSGSARTWCWRAS